MRFWKSALALLCFPMLLAAQTIPARFTPESGLWWNPAEDGRGYAMEIQDNIIAILVYGYDNDAERTSAFFTAAGAMQGNSLFSGPLDGATNGQCLTCVYIGRPVILAGAGGAISVVFDTESRGRLTMGGRTFPIERLNFALGNPTERMQGEWQLVLDFANPANTAPPNESPYFGEILTIDSLDTSLNPDQYKGCRPSNSRRRCAAADYTSHGVAGFYDAAADLQIIVVRDQVNAAGTPFFLAYYVKAGLSQFDGVVAFRTSATGTDACSPVVMAACFPVRGFRSASKRFVQTGTGPSSGDPKSGVAAATRPGVVESMGGIDRIPQGLNAGEVKSRYGIDMQALEPRVQALIRSMQ